MAEASVVVTVTDELPLPGRGLLVCGALAVDAAADTYAAGGLALGAAEFRGKLLLSAESKPKYMLVSGIAGYHYEYKVSTGKLFIRQSAAAANPEAEIPTAAVPAAVSGDTISFMALFEKFPNA